MAVLYRAVSCRIRSIERFAVFVRLSLIKTGVAVFSVFKRAHAAKNTLPTHFTHVTVHVSPNTRPVTRLYKPRNLLFLRHQPPL